MKKTIAWALSIITLFTCLCACNGANPNERSADVLNNNDDKYTQNIDGTSLSEEELKELSKIVDAYKLILKDNRYIHLPSYDGIALADLNQDGIAEIVLRASDEFTILHYFEGQAYTHSLSWRVDITKGGTCRWSVQAGREHGTYRIQFREKELISVDKTLIKNDCTEEAEYYINGVPTTLENINTIAACNEPIKFVEFNKDNVKLLITSDSLINKSLMCNCNHSIDE